MVTSKESQMARQRHGSKDLRRAPRTTSTASHILVRAYLSGTSNISQSRKRYLYVDVGNIHSRQHGSFLRDQQMEELKERR